MPRLRLLALASTLAFVLPFAIADPSTPGVPDFTCQTPQEWNTHDYGAPGTGNLVALISDNNLEECGTTYGFFIAGEADCELIRDTVGDPVYTAVCRNDRPADYDGDMEYAIGGALLVSRSGAANSPSGLTTGAGGLECLGTTGHHPAFGTVYVNDLLFGSDVLFTVTSDWSRPELVVPGQPDCGDGTNEECGNTGPSPSDLPPPLDPLNAVVDEVNVLVYNTLNDPSATCNADDRSIDCYGRCTVPFPPGADGGYVVFMQCMKPIYYIVPFESLPLFGDDDAPGSKRRIGSPCGDGHIWL